MLFKLRKYVTNTLNILIYLEDKESSINYKFVLRVLKPISDVPAILMSIRVFSSIVQISH